MNSFFFFQIFCWHFLIHNMHYLQFENNRKMGTSRTRKKKVNIHRWSHDFAERHHFKGKRCLLWLLFMVLKNEQQDGFKMRSAEQQWQICNWKSGLIATWDANVRITWFFFFFFFQILWHIIAYIFFSTVFFFFKKKKTHKKNR